MDNLEEQFIESLVAENRDEFLSNIEIENCLKQLAGPISDIDELGIGWVQHVPQSVLDCWGELPVSTKFMAMMLCRKVQSLKVMLKSYEDSISESS